MFKSESSLSEIMLELVRAAVLDRKPSVSIGAEIDWDQLMSVSAKHDVLAWVWDGVCKLPETMQPNRLQKINWGLSAQEVWDNYWYHKKVLSSIIEICNRNDIRLLLLKGVGLSKMYPKPESRLSNDIDIFLYDDYEKGNMLLADNTFYFGGKHAVFNYSGVTIENHQNFFIHGSKIQKRVDDFLLGSAGESELCEDGYYELPKVPGLVYLLLHSMVHMNNPRERLTLRNIVDFSCYLHYHKHDLNPCQCGKIMKQLGLEKGFDLFLQLSSWFIKEDFSHYRSELSVNSQDVGNAVNLILADTPFSKDRSGGSVLKQLYDLFCYDYSTKWKYAYVPNRRILNKGLLKVVLKKSKRF